MSLITLKSRFDAQDNAFLFKCDFPQPIVIKPNSEVELMNFECRRADGYVISDNNNVFRIKLGGKTDIGYAQRLAIIPNGNYSGVQLAREFARQLNSAMVNSAYKESAITIAAGNKSGWEAHYYAQGGNNNGPYIELENYQNLISDLKPSPTDSKTDWVYANVNSGTTMNTTSYMDQLVNVAPTTFAAGTNLTGVWTEMLPKSATPQTEPENIHRNIMSNFGVYERGQYSVILPRHAGGGIITGNGTINAGPSGAGIYAVDDTGDFKTQTGTGQGASYKITAVDGAGQITSFDVLNAGAGYAIGDILEFEESGGAGLFSTWTIATGVEPVGAGGFYRTRVGISRYELFEGADWLSDPNGAFSNQFGDIMVDVRSGNQNTGDPQIKVSYTKYSTSVAPPGPNWRIQTTATDRDFQNLSALLTSYTKGDNLLIDFERVSGRVDIYVNHDSANDFVFDAANRTLIATTNVAIGDPGGLSKSVIKETKFPYVAYAYMSSGVNNDNKIKVSGIFSNINKATIIEAQQFHNTTGRFPVRVSANANLENTYVSSQAIESLDIEKTEHSADELGASAPGDPLALSVMLRGQFIEESDLVSQGGGFPDEYFRIGGTTFPNDANAGHTLGLTQGYLVVPNGDPQLTNPFKTKFIEPLQEISEAAYHIEISELPVISYNGFSRDVNKDIMVIPREQLTTGEITGALTWNSQYRIAVDLHNVDVMYINSLTTYIRDSDGKFSTGLEKPTQLTIKISEKQDFSKTMRGMIREMNVKMGEAQSNMISNIGSENRLL
jgi:hypothetical protein